MKGGGGGGSDPYDLDPFGDDPTPNSLAFALQANAQAAQIAEDARRLVEHQLTTIPEYDNAVAKSARKSSLAQLASIEALRDVVAQIADAARQEVVDSGDPNKCPSAGRVVDASSLLVAPYQKLLATLPKIDEPDAPPIAAAPVLPPNVEAPMQASQAVHDDLKKWVTPRRSSESGELAVVKATAGVGKTYAMIGVAIDEQLAGQRVVVASRTKDQLIGDHPELVERLITRNPLGKVALAVIVGRGEHNCKEWDSVKAATEHGYSPGQSVCLKCDYYPDNATVYGWSPCDYYGERIRAHLLSRGARIGSHNHYPMIVTNHASVVAAHSSQGGRWGGFWAADLILFDEDPTDSIETDLILTEEQCRFRSPLRENRHANMAAILLTKAIEVGKGERTEAKSNNFKKPGTGQHNAHPVHGRRSSDYVGNELHEALGRATASCQQTVMMPALERVLCDVADSQGFHVNPGDLLGVVTAAAINQQGIPPKALSDMGAAIHAEMNHALALQRIVYKKVFGHNPPQSTLAEILAELDKHTDVEPLSYTCRLECLAADTAKGRKKDEWRFVVREFTPFANHKSSIVIGDAYAQKEHYEQLFLRPAHMIEHVSSLHGDTNIYRLQHDQCTIGQLRAGGLVDVLSVVENRMREMVRPGDRVLIYGHQVLRHKISQWMEAVADQLGVVQWEYEHWWGGRGKDQYNGWEHTFCISDPILNLSGIKHVTNARAFRDSLAAKTDDTKLEHGGRIEIADAGRAKNNTLHALSSSHERITLEHERMNVAEVTQAIHRGRPVHNPTNIVIVGAPELSIEIAAQTINVTESERLDGHGGATLIEPARDHEGFPMVHAFVTEAECKKLLRAILNHYGVFSPWMNHALLAAPVDDDRPSSGTSLFRGQTAEKLNDCGYPAVATKEQGTELPVSAGIRPDPVAEPHPLSMPEDARLTDGARDASRKERRSMTVIRRVWDPPLKWLVPSLQTPWAARQAIKALAADPSIQSIRAPMPSWRKSQPGCPPKLYYDPTLLGGGFRIDSAVSAYLNIIETQYGPERDGRLVRPNFNEGPPPLSMSTPF